MKLLVTLENKDLFNKYIENGVNEIIVALKEHTFSSLNEFDLDTIQLVTKEAHENDILVTVLMNRLYAQQDVNEALKVLDKVIVISDYVMFADPALLKHAKEKGYENKLVYRPETLMTCSEDAKIWKSFGLHSVVIPSLLTKQEVVEIAHDVKDTTVIIHGHTLMSVSKRKLISAYQHVTNQDFDIHDKSLSLKEKTRDTLMPVYENAYSTLIYTDFIQESFEEMKEFMPAGVEYFEIDTVYMNEEMILDTIKVYRDILDGKQMDESYLLKYKDLNMTDGYYGQKTVK